MQQFSNIVFANGATVTGLPTPTVASDATPKTYVDTQITAVQTNGIKSSVTIFTAIIGTVTYQVPSNTAVYNIYSDIAVDSTTNAIAASVILPINAKVGDAVIVSDWGGSISLYNITIQPSSGHYIDNVLNSIRTMGAGVYGNNSTIIFKLIYNSGGILKWKAQ